MFKMERVLLATDFSAGAARALAYASFFASAWKTHLDLLHVIPLWPDVDLLGVLDCLKLDQIRQEIRVKLEDLGSQMRRTGVRAQAYQDEGIPSERIVAAAGIHKADLVVVGSHGHNGLEQVLLGSTAERVVKGAPCPVLTVRTRHLRGKHPSSGESTDAIRMHHILLATDLLESSLPDSRLRKSVRQDIQRLGSNSPRDGVAIAWGRLHHQCLCRLGEVARIR